jgi:predicted ATP-dependent serine protease
MAKYCKICGAEWEENFDECPNCGMPADPDEQLWFDKDARQRLERKKLVARKKPIRRISKLNRGIFLPLIIGTAGVFRMIAGGISAETLIWDVISVFMFVVSVGYIIRAKFFR